MDTQKKLAQRLHRGDRIRVRGSARNPAIRNKEGTFRNYTDAGVIVDGKYHLITVNSIEPMNEEAST